MPTVIDSLLVTLGLDAKQFHKEKDKVDKGIKDTAKKGSEGFNELAKSATKFFAIVGGTYAIKRFVADQIAANSALDRFSKNLGESANTVSAWGNAAEQAGGSVQGLQGTMGMLSRAQTELQLTGESGLIPYFSALGLSLADAHGKALPVSQILLELADRFSHMNRTTANNIGGMMGIDQGTMQLLLQGRPAVQSALDAQKQFGAVTQKQADEAQRLNTEIIALEQSFTAFGREMLSDSTPALEQFFIQMKDFAQWAHENKEPIEVFLGSIAIGLTAIGAAAVVSINPVIAGLLALSAAIASAYKMGQNLKNNGNPFDSSTPNDAYTDRQKFIKAAAAKLGVPESAIAAQLSLETGANGTKTIGKYNYGNIKTGHGYNGDFVNKDVTEYKNGMAYTDRAQFRSYGSPEAAAEDYAAMIARKFPSAVGAKDAISFASGLQAGGYATDPAYVAKIARIASGIPGASNAAMGAGAQSRLSGLATTSNNNSIQTTIGSVVVNTTADNAPGIARDMGKSLDYLFTSQANYGLK